MNATVIGCGRWGSFIAWYLDNLGYNVMLYGREESEHFFKIRVNNGNGMVKFGPNVRYTEDLDEALSFAEWIFGGCAGFQRAYGRHGFKGYPK